MKKLKLVSGLAAFSLAFNVFSGLSVKKSQAASLIDDEVTLAICDFEGENSLISWETEANPSGGSVTVEKDPVSGSNALKLVHPWLDLTDGDTATYARYNMTKVDSGVVKVSYDIRFANHAVTAQCLGLMYSDGWAAPGYNIGTISGFFKVADEPCWSSDELTENSEKYYTVEQVVDFENGTYRAKVLKDGTEIIDSGLKTIDSSRNFSDIAKLQFNFINDTVRPNGNDKPEDSNAVYYIDNVKVEKVRPKILETSLKNGAENVSADLGNVTIAFNYPLTASTINKTNIKLLKAGSETEDYTVTLNEDGKTVKVTLNKLEYNASYKIVLKKGIQNINKLGMTADYGIEFSTEKNPDILAICDFEGENSLTSWETEANPSGGSVTVEKDPVSGSNALKLVHPWLDLTDGDTATCARYNMTKVDSGVVKVSYDIRFANHAVTAQCLGLMYSDGWAAPGYSIGTISGSFKVADEPCWSSDKLTENSEKYYTVEQVVDFENGTYRAKVLKDGTEIIDSGLKTIDSSRNFSDISKLQFNFINDTVRPNGNDKPEDSNAVYYIDNVKVEKVRFALDDFSVNNSEENVEINKKLVAKFNDEVNDEFENYIKVCENGSAISDYSLIKNGNQIEIKLNDGLEYGTEYKISIEAGIKNASGNLATEKAYNISFKTKEYSAVKSLLNMDFEDFTAGNVVTGNGITVNSIKDGDKLEITQDTAGSKALKMTRAEENVGSNDKTEFTVSLDTPADKGTVKVSYDIRFANYRAGMAEAGSLEGTGNSDVNKIFIHGQYMYPVSGDVAYRIADDNGVLNGTDAGYMTVERTIDLSTGKFKVRYITPNGIFERVEYQGNAGEADHLRFTLAEHSANGVYGASGALEYYIDNIRVELMEYPEIIWSAPANGNENTPASENVLLYSSVRLDEKSVNTSNIEVYENDVKIGTDKYSVALDNGSQIKITFAEKMKKNENYTVSVKGLLSKGKEQLAMKQAYELKFKTADDISVISKKTAISAENDKLEYRVVLENNTEKAENYMAFAALYNSDERLVSVKSAGGTMKTEEYTVLEGNMDMPEEYNSSYSVKMILWNSSNGMTPLKETIELPLPEKRTYGADVVADESKALKVAYIGGSLIEQGHITAALKDEMAEIFPNREISYISAGVGGTGSALQMHRVYNDIIKYSPDIVFVDATVNDATSEKAGETFEAVIRRLMTAEHQPVVIRLGFGTQNGNWEKAEPKHQAVCEYYGIESVKVGEYIKSNIASEDNPNGKYVWTEAEKATYPNASAITAADGTHPTAEGGKMYAEYISEVLRGDYNKFMKKMLEKETPLHTDKYDNAIMLPWYAGEYAGEWTTSEMMPEKFKDGMAVSQTGGSKVTFEFYGSAFALYGIGGKTGLGMTYSVDGGIV